MSGGSEEHWMKEEARKIAEDPAQLRSISSQLQQRREMLEDASAAPPPKKDALPLLVSDLLDADPLTHDVAKTRLELAGADAEDALLAAFDDPRCTWEKEGDHVLDTSPAERVSNQLMKIPSRRLGQRLAQLVEDTNYQARTTAICACAAQGCDALAENVAEWLRADASTRSAAQDGIQVAIQQEWAEAEFMQAVVDWAREDIIGSAQHPSAFAARFYAVYGGADAIQFLISPDVFNVDNKSIAFVIEALNDNEITIPVAQILPIIERAMSKTDPWPWNWILRPALQALARSDFAKAKAIATSVLTDIDAPSAKYAVQILREIEGLPEPWNCIAPDNLNYSVEDRQVLHILELCMEVSGQVSNGGLSQYFFNSSGDRWPEAVDALRAIGFEQGAEELHKAAHVLNKRGASIDREVRIAEYAKVSRRREKELDDRSDTFWSNHFEFAVLQYMLRHKSLFTRIREEQDAAETTAEDTAEKEFFEEYF